MSALWRIVEVLGPAVLRLVSSPDGAHAEVGEVVLFDPAEPDGPGPGDLVLAVGTGGDVAAMSSLIAACGEAGAAAVACKPPAADDLALGAAADEAGVALLRVEPEVTWGQLYLLTREATVSANQPVDRQAASIRLGDLFAVADVIAARAGGPVTIEDARSRVLAYSNTPETELDEPRRQTILGRGVPPEWLHHLEDSGVFRRLWNTDEVVEMPAIADLGLHRRFAVRVRAGKHVLGAVWLAEGTTALASDAAEALSEAARFVALHLLAHQSKADVEREVRGNLLRQVLDGQGSPELLAERLGIRANDSCSVVAFRVLGIEGPDALSIRDSVVSLIALHSEAFRWQAASIWMGDTVYTLLPTDSPPSRVLTLAKDLVDRIDTVLNVTAVAGVGSTVDGLDRASASRREADLALRALSLRGGTAATIDEISAQRVLLVLSDLLADHPELASEKVKLLLASDAEQGTLYVETLRGYLDAFGSIPKAAEDLGVHPNTLRYRLRRALELADLDLEDGDERVVVELGLRLLSTEGDIVTDLFGRLVDRRDDMLADLEGLVAVESPSDDVAATTACAQHTAALFSRLLGADAEHCTAGGRVHLRWSFGRPRVLLLGHIDTVWPLGTVARWPFEVTGGTATGPGAFDMKAGVVQGVHALTMLDNLDGVSVLLTTDEEIGSPTSRGLIEETARGLDATLVLEPSVDGALKTGRKGVSNYVLRVAGRASHAGLEPEKGINALVELAHQVLAAGALAAPDLGTTVTPTVAAAGTAGNVVPAAASMTLDVRAATDAEQRRVDTALRDLVPVLEGAALALDGEINRPALAESASAGLFAQALQTAALLGLPALTGQTVGGGSDGNFTAGLGVPTLDGLGAVGAGAHAEGEHVVVAAMPERAALVAGLLADLLS